MFLAKGMLSRKKNTLQLLHTEDNHETIYKHQVIMRLLKIVKLTVPLGIIIYFQENSGID